MYVDEELLSDPEDRIFINLMYNAQFTLGFLYMLKEIYGKKQKGIRVQTKTTPTRVVATVIGFLISVTFPDKREFV